MKITAEMFDGTVHEADVSAKAYMGVGDRVAFERRFATSVPGVMQRVAGLVEEDEDGKARPAKDANFDDLREEQIVFFSWRALRRAVEDLPDFDDFLDGLAELEVDVTDPTEPVERDNGHELPPDLQKLLDSAGEMPPEVQKALDTALTANSPK